MSQESTLARGQINRLTEVVRASLGTPTPVIARLLLRMLSEMLMVAVLLLRMPPPSLPLPLPDFPFEIESPEKVTTAGLGAVTLKTRTLLLPEIVN